MKNLKFLLLALLSFSPLFQSCQEETIEVKTTDELAEFKTAKFFEQSVNLISEELKDKIRNSFNKGNSIVLTQAELNQCLAISGYTGPVPSLQEVNTIINLTMNAVNNGQVVFPIEPSGFSPLDNRTNNLISQMLSNGSFENLKANSDYYAVNYSEQQLLEYINNLVIAMENGELNFVHFKGIMAFCGINNQAVPCSMAFAVAGGAIGASFGVGGAIVGVIIGGVVGAFVDAS